MTAFLRAHWPLALAALLGAAVAWFLKPNPAPAVHEKAAAKADTRVEEGAWSVKTWEYAPKPPAAGSARSADAGQYGSPDSVAPAVPDTGLILYREETHAPTVAESHAEQHLDLTVTPATQPGWAVGVGVDGLTERQLRLSARRRLLGPFWAEIAFVPKTHALGAGLSVEF